MLTFAQKSITRLPINGQQSSARISFKEQGITPFSDSLRTIQTFTLDCVGDFDRYRVSDNDFGKARGRNPSKAYRLVRRRGFRPITQSKIFIWKPIVKNPGPEVAAYFINK